MIRLGPCRQSCGVGPQDAGHESEYLNSSRKILFIGRGIENMQSGDACVAICIQGREAHPFRSPDTATNVLRGCKWSSAPGEVALPCETA